MVPVSGGSFASADGVLSVSVPPNALSTTTPLSITPISNLARGGIGPAYRLRPEGTAFAAPVALTFQAPLSYPRGMSFAGVVVESQDAAGYWHPVTPSAQDPDAKTVTVVTTHFSDWALTWQSGTPVAEGPISLYQTVGIPFLATGTGTLYFVGDDPYDTTYGFTGTLTLPASIPYGGATCTPDERTKTLPLNFAEVHKGTPPVFRWGIGVVWQLSCSDGTALPLPAQFDTMYINLTGCPGSYGDGQLVSSTELSGMYTKDCGAGGIVTASWDLLTCFAGQPCSTGVDCRLGLTACNGGLESCADAGPASDGTPCSFGTCTAGVCGP